MRLDHPVDTLQVPRKGVGRRSVQIRALGKQGCRLGNPSPVARYVGRSFTNQGREFVQDKEGHLSKNQGLEGQGNLKVEVKHATDLSDGKSITEFQLNLKEANSIAKQQKQLSSEQGFLNVEGLAFFYLTPLTLSGCDFGANATVWLAQPTSFTLLVLLLLQPSVWDYKDIQYWMSTSQGKPPGAALVSQTTTGIWLGYSFTLR